MEPGSREPAPRRRWLNIPAALTPSAHGKLKLAPPMQVVCLEWWGMLYLALLYFASACQRPLAGACFLSSLTVAAVIDCPKAVSRTGYSPTASLRGTMLTEIQARL